MTADSGDLFDPELFTAADLAVFAAARARGETVRASVECVLRQLPRERSERFLQLSKESRGVWSLLLSARAGRALFVGSPFSGAVVPLAAVGLDVTLLDTSAQRLACAELLAAEQVDRPVRGVAGQATRLPFAAGAFDVVACDLAHPDDALLAELRRVCAGELFLAVDNRLGYKRSSGRAWDLRVRGPLEFALRALHPRGGERTLAGWRRALESAGFPAPRSLALYPDRRDFAQVVALDAATPALHVGPNERRNRVKLLAHAAGLFPHLTPSFALMAGPDGRAGTSRLERALAFLAEATGEGPSACEHLIGSRGNVAIVMSANPRAARDDPRGRWLLHIPLFQGHGPGLGLHFEMLAHVRASFPAVPAPEPLFCGDAEGLWLCCERRLPGFGSHHHMRSIADAEGLLAQIAPQVATLAVSEAGEFGEAEFEAELLPHYEATLRHIADASVRRGLEQLRERTRAELVGRRLPRVLTHGDLRAKHIQIGPDGRVNGYLDWGTSTRSELPGMDLLHLFVHLRKQLFGHGDGQSWRTFLDPRGPTPAELASFAGYAQALGLDLAALRAIALFYPAFVGSTAARNWSVARPRWFQEHFPL